MAILLIKKKPTNKEIKTMTEEYSSYIKLVADVNKNILYGGSRLHADIEKILIENNSLQKDIWGGGIDLETKKIECTAVANIRPNLGNSSMEILDAEIRKKFIKIVKDFFKNFNE
jgi:hypothetical protein